MRDTQWFPPYLIPWMHAFTIMPHRRDIEVPALPWDISYVGIEDAVPDVSPEAIERFLTITNQVRGCMVVAGAFVLLERACVRV